MTPRAPALRNVAIVALALLLAGALFVPVAAAAKKKKSSNLFTQQATTNSAIPDRVGTGVSTPLTATINVPKKFKGREVADVNVTGLQTTGSAAGAATQLTAYLTAPGGRTLQLFFAVGNQSLGPWTMDDDTKTSICNSSGPVCSDPDQALYQPFAGTSNVLRNWNGTFPVNGALSIFNGVGMRGTWKLTVVDGAATVTSVLNQWGLRIQAARKAKS